MEKPNIISQAVQQDSTTQSLYERNKLRIAGSLNFIGDVAMLAEGYQKNDDYIKAAGGLYTLGASNLAWFGAADSTQKVQDLREETAKFLHENITLKDSSLESSRILAQRDNSLTGSLMRSLQSNAANITLLLYTLGAATMLVKGVKNYSSMQAKGADTTEAKATIAYGAFSLLVKAVSLGLKESPEGKPAKGIIGWLKERPLRFFGYASLLTETMLAWRTYGQYKQGAENNYSLSALTAASYAASDVVIANASKQGGASNKLETQEQAQLEDMVVETIAQQEVSTQEVLLKKSVKFFKGQSAVQGDEKVLEASLRDKLSTYNQPKEGMWVSHIAKQAAELSAEANLGKVA